MPYGGEVGTRLGETAAAGRGGEQVAHQQLHLCHCHQIRIPPNTPTIFYPEKS